MYKIEQIKAALQQPLPGVEAQLRMVGRVRAMPQKIPPYARQSAILCLLIPINGTLSVLLIKRREDNTAHSGQVSFPGGRFEPSDKDYKTTALRETYEEVGVEPDNIEILGALTSLYIPVSNYNVHPFIGYLPHKPEYQLSHKEVAFTMEVPLPELFARERKIVTDVMSPVINQPIKNVNAYRLIDGTVIWGATAMILSELEALVCL